MRSEASNAEVLRDYATHMRIAKNSEATIRDRLRLLRSLARFLDSTPLLGASEDQLREFQATFAHKAPATANVYSRHTRTFYAWARRRRYITVDPAVDLDVPRVPRARPHPATPDQLRLVFACTRGALRLAYVLATFAGLRCAEVCRLQRPDLDIDAREPTALITGKSGHERIVPLLPPVLDELYDYGMPRAGFVVLHNGNPYTASRLSIASHKHLKELGISTTLHSMRGTFATQAGRITRDPMFVRDLLGHVSVKTTEIYVQTNLTDAHDRLSGLCDVATELLGLRRSPSGQGLAS